MTRKITDAEFKIINTELLDAMKAVVDRHNLGVSYRGGKYGINRANLTLRYELTTRDEGGATMTEEREALINMLPLLQLRPNAMDIPFKVQERTFKLSGYKCRARKFPFLAVDQANGVEYSLTPASVQRALGINTQTTIKP